MPVSQHTSQVEDPARKAPERKPAAPRPTAEGFLEPREALGPGARPESVLRMQRLAGNQVVRRSLAAKTPISAQPMAAQPVIQRTLDQAGRDRLKSALGAKKYARVVEAKMEDAFAQLSDARLAEYKAMQNTKFDALLAQLAGKESKWSQVLGFGNLANTAADIASAAVETGDETGKVAAFMSGGVGSLTGRLASAVGGAEKLKVGDSAVEAGSGALGGLKDTVEGGMSAGKQKKLVEGGMGVVSGLSGIAGAAATLMEATPGVSNAIGLVGSGAKALGGITKLVNNRINVNAIERLKAAAHAFPAMIKALDALAAKLGYLEGAKQTAYGLMEGAGSLWGGALGKWGASLVSKSADSLMSMGMYAGRAVASTVTSRVDSNAAVSEREEKDKQAAMVSMREAVMTAASAPDLIGRLHRLCILIAPEYAQAVDAAVESLPDAEKTAVKAAIKAKDTWNPD